MKSIIEYIMLNYTWFLGGAIIILLAIIGSYADKTNFGQGKTKETEEKKDDELNLENIEDSSDEEIEEKIDEKDSSIDKEKKVNQEAQMVDIEKDSDEKTSSNNSVKAPENIIEKKENFEELFEKFDKEFNEVLPEKDIIDDDLLDEIDSLSLDKTQKLKLSDIPDLDDVELPRIKSLKSEDEDIWKF